MRNCIYLMAIIICVTSTFALYAHSHVFSKFITFMSPVYKHMCRQLHQADRKQLRGYTKRRPQGTSRYNLKNARINDRYKDIMHRIEQKLNKNDKRTRMIQDATLVSLIGTFTSVYTMLYLTDFTQSAKCNTSSYSNER